MEKNNLIRSKYGFLFTVSGLLFLQLIIFTNSVTAQDSLLTKSKLKLVAETVLEDVTFNFTDQQTGTIYNSTDEAPSEAQIKPASAYNDWRYWNGVLNIAMINLADALDETKYKDFAVKNIAFMFDSYKYFEEKHTGENKWSYPFGQRFILEELDDGGAMGASVIEVYKLDRQERYKKYIDQVADQMMNKQTRLDDGTFVRSFPHKWTLWADDLYMGLSFLCRMGELTNETKYFDDAAQQVINFHKYLFDKSKGIMHHCMYSDVDRRGVAYWGRANGWALLAQVDLLDRLPEDHPKRDELISLLQKHILGIAHYQSESGLWHQLLDKADSYLETSCSAMFTYAIARAVNKGYIEPRYITIAQRGWEGVMSTIREDGQIEGVCTGTVVSDDLVYYYKRPAPLNDVHGIGFIILAGAEILNFTP
ncbi:MAG: glycoside hydrolase family 88 protein [Ignavibacteria bacterium]|jgi:rhamnogalacturonyl hydrolase YesR